MEQAAVEFMADFESGHKRARDPDEVIPDDRLEGFTEEEAYDAVRDYVPLNLDIEESKTEEDVPPLDNGVLVNDPPRTYNAFRDEALLRRIQRRRRWNDLLERYGYESRKRYSR